MSLDFHLATSERQAEKQHPSLHIEYSLHEEFVSRCIEKSTGQISKIADYYADAQYDLKEVLNLQAEVDSLICAIEKGELQTWLKALRKLCDEAIVNGLNIYVFCD